MIGQIATALGLLVGTRVLTELTPPQVFGVVVLLLGIYSFGRSVFCVSILQAAMRFHPEVARQGGLGRLHRTISRLLFRTMMVPVTAAIVGGLVSVMRGGSFLPFLILAGLMGVDAARSHQVVRLVAARRQKAAALLDGAEALVRPGLFVVLILVLGAQAQTLLLAYLMASASVFLLARGRLRREAEGAGPPDAGEASLAREVLSYALPLMPMAAVTWISNLSDRYILGGIVGEGQVGIYAAAYALMSTPFLMIQGFLDRTLTPPYFDAVASGNERSEHRVFRTLLWATVGLCGTGVLLVVVLKSWIGSILLAEPYRESIPLMPWIALGNALLATEYCLAKHRYAHKQTRDILLVQVVGALAALATTLPLVSAHGARGAAIACPIYFAVQLAFSLALRRARGTGKRSGSRERGGQSDLPLAGPPPAARLPTV